MLYTGKATNSQEEIEAAREVKRAEEALALLDDDTDEQLAIEAELRGFCPAGY